MYVNISLCRKMAWLCIHFYMHNIRLYSFTNYLYPRSEWSLRKTLHGRMLFIIVRAKADLIPFPYPIIIIKGFATTYPSTFPSFIFSKAISLDNFKLSSVIFPDSDGLFHAEQSSLYLVLHAQDPTKAATNVFFI